MELAVRDMGSLFAQLGKANDAKAIALFIESHGPLGREVLLHEAGFWTLSQANFLREAILDDANWAGVVDALNAELHAASGTLSSRDIP